MGYYVETGTLKGKAKIIAEQNGTTVVGKDAARTAMADPTKGVICVMDNGPFEAAGFAFNMSEFDAFGRAREFVILPREVAKSLSNCRLP